MLLQEIRARQVLQEEGLNLPIRIEHKENPKTIIGDREFKLIFPKFMFNYANNNQKDIETLFCGLITDKRKPFLNKFKAEIINSNRGRDNQIKNLDKEYFNLMSRAKFVLCPDGDFVWTYRFFEAIIFKAIPIIQNNCPLYEGYKFYNEGDKMEYKEEWIEHNLNKLKREMTWT
jgi:hypothetical protein